MEISKAQRLADIEQDIANIQGIMRDDPNMDFKTMMGFQQLLQELLEAKKKEREA